MGATLLPEGFVGCVQDLIGEFRAQLRAYCTYTEVVGKSRGIPWNQML